MTIRKCVQCEKEFQLTDSEIKFYKDKGLSLPKRCEDCRRKNKASEQQEVKSGYQPKQEENRQGAVKRGLAVYFRKHPVLAAVLAVILAAVGISFNTSYNLFEDYSFAGQESQTIVYSFRNEDYLISHFNKHKEEFNYATAEEYLLGANRVIQSKDVLHKTEAEDGDDVYYLKESNELVIISTDGYLRTYFKPSDGIDYFNRQ